MGRTLGTDLQKHGTMTMRKGPCDMPASKRRLTCTCRKSRRACGLQSTREPAQFWTHNARFWKKVQIQRVQIAGGHSCKFLKRMAPQVSLESSVKRKYNNLKRSRGHCFRLFSLLSAARHGNMLRVLSDRQPVNHSFINSVRYANASIAALVQFLGTGKDNHAAFIFKKPDDRAAREAG